MSDGQLDLFSTPRARPVVTLPAERLAGELRRDIGLARVLAATDDPWKRAALEAIEALARSGEPFTSETLRAEVGDPPRPNVMGAIFQIAARAGVITKIGFTKATRASLHATDLAVWTGTPNKASA